MAQDIIVSPGIPEDVLEKSFEGFLLGKMFATERRHDGALAVDPRTGFEEWLVPHQLLTAANAHPSGLSEKLLPLIERIIGKPELQGLLLPRNLAEELGLESFGLEHLLQEICRNNRDRLSHFEVTWSVRDDNMRHGRLGRGAQFITADGVKEFNADRWIEEQRGLLLHDDLQQKLEWELLDGGSYYQLLPRTTWQSIIHEDAQDLVMIDETNGGYEVSIQLSGAGVRQFVTLRRSLDEAMRVGGGIVYEAGNTADDKVLASMGLSDQEWELGYGEHGEPAAFSIHGSKFTIEFIREVGRWVFHDGDGEVADADDPADLAETARDYLPANRAS